MNRLFVPFLLFGVFLFGALGLFAPQPVSAVTIAWTPVGNPGNVADQNFDGQGQFGAVPYAYNIGTTEVSNSQYAEFLSAVGATDTYGLYNASMGSSELGGINRNGSSGSYAYSVKTNYGNLPVNYVSWYDAIRFANWLNNGQGSGDTETGAYALGTVGAGGIPIAPPLTHDAGAKIWLPTEDEWYKAAYYNPATSSYFQYPTSSNTLPSNAFLDAGNNANFYDSITDTLTTGSPYLTDVGHFATSESPYGTFDQGGNVWEWNEALIEGSGRALRGGTVNYFSEGLLSSTRLDSFFPDNEVFSVGFRVASIPEPSSMLLAGLGVLGLALFARRTRIT
jgi:sulfatase modifying factor 1